jgi:hypothetical protein
MMERPREGQLIDNLEFGKMKGAEHRREALI